MKTYLVGYDLNKPGQDYSDLFKAIKAIGNWWHGLDSTWIVKTNLSAGEIRDRLKPPVTDQNDHLVVVRLEGDWASWHTEETNKWFTENVSLN